MRVCLRPSLVTGFVEQIYVNDSGVAELDVDLLLSEENGVSFRSTSFESLAEAIRVLGDFLGCADAWGAPVSLPSRDTPPDFARLRSLLLSETYPLPSSGSFRYSGLSFWREPEHSSR